MVSDAYLLAAPARYAEAEQPPPPSEAVVTRSAWPSVIADEWQKFTTERYTAEGFLDVGIMYRLAYIDTPRLSLTQPMFLAGKALSLRILVQNRLVVWYALPGSIHFREEVESFARTAIEEASSRLGYMALMVKRWAASEPQKEIPE